MVPLCGVPGMARHFLFSWLKESMLAGAIVVVPTYNEAENIGTLIEQVAATVPDIHLMVVDDASPDGTADVAEKHCADHPGFRVYRRTGPRGFGRAYKDGFCKALAEGY